MKKKRISKFKERKIELKEISKLWNGIQEYKVYESVPEELRVKEEHIGLRLEVAGYKRTDYFKLKRINSDNVMVVDATGQFKNFRLEAIALHRNEKIRNSILDINQLYYSKVKKVSDMGKNRNKIRRKSKEVIEETEE